MKKTCEVTVHPLHEKRARPCGQPATGEVNGKARCKRHRAIAARNKAASARPARPAMEERSLSTTKLTPDQFGRLATVFAEARLAILERAERLEKAGPEFLIDAIDTRKRAEEILELEQLFARAREVTISGHVHGPECRHMLPDGSAASNEEISMGLATRWCEMEEP